MTNLKHSKSSKQEAKMQRNWVTNVLSTFTMPTVSTDSKCEFVVGFIHLLFLATTTGTLGFPRERVKSPPNFRFRAENVIRQCTVHINDLVSCVKLITTFLKFPVHPVLHQSELYDALSNQKNKRMTCCTFCSDRACHLCGFLCDYGALLPE